ncbi:unnamed protein product, partial [Brugia timori]|uniref:NTF2 domain-containing protein n=1 Tax=Brugia timori TaxID=42155 RepID=A0A0R3R819_9BILA
MREDGLVLRNSFHVTANRLEVTVLASAYKSHFCPRRIACLQWSFSSNMKMEGVGDVINGRANEVAKTPQPSPKEIGREFVRQYYTMLSERPQDVFRFYSHESYFVHDTDQPVQGQQKIQKAIERLAFIDCKARIYTVSGTATMNNGLVIQVCGELSIGDNPGRRFLQTFILCPQTPKKYYVHNDVFQWLDRAFGDAVIQSQKS